MSNDRFIRQNSPKPCKFCGKAAAYSPLEEMERHGVHVYFCRDCSAEYLFYWDGTLGSTSLYTEIGKNTYRWSVSHDETTAVLWHIKNPGEPGRRINTDLVSIKSFDTRKGEVVHALTPENINEKVKTWLLFL